MSIKKIPKRQKLAKKTVVTIELTRVRALSAGNEYGCFIPGFGSPGCSVVAANATAAKKAVASFVGNELESVKVIGG